MNRHKLAISFLALISLFVVTVAHAGPAFTDQFTTDLASSTLWNWTSDSSGPTGTANVAASGASDGKILRLTIPAGQAANPGNGSNLQSKTTYSYGTYETRLKTATCPTSEGVINGFFTYQNGGDSNGNGLPDNSEIDFEWLCAEPQSIYMTLWTDYNDATAESRRVFRKVNLATGTIEYTRYSTNFGGAFTDLSGSPTENQPSSIAPLAGYNSSAAYYEYGFTWTETSITMWVINPANGQKITLWDYRGPSARITKVPAAYMANIWHTSSWAPECCPNALGAPTAARSLDIDWIRYTPPGATPTPTPITPTPITPTPVTPTPTPPPTGTNLALNKPATASSIEAAGLEAGKAVDGNAGTRWASAYSDPQWLQVDLGASYNLNRVVLKWEAAYGKAYRIDTSADGVNWTQRYATTTGDGATDDLAISGSGRYVRVYGTQRGTAWGYSLWEFEVYGNGGSTPTPSPTPPTPTSGPPSNIPLTNPGFEANGATQAPTGWNTWGAAAADSNADFTESFGGSHGGTYHLTQYAEAPYEVFTYQTKTGLANGTYTLKAWVRSTGGQTAVEMQAKEFNGSATILRQAVPANDTWNQITIGNIQVTNGQIVLGFYSKSPAYKYLYVDDVTLVRN